MLPLLRIIRHRDLAVQDRSTGNTEKKKKKIESNTKVKKQKKNKEPKVKGKKNKDKQREDKCSMFSCLPSFKLKFKGAKQEYVVAETIKDYIGDEDVIVNQLLLFDEEVEMNKRLKTKRMTPANYSETSQCLKYSIRSEQNLYRAAHCLEDLLSRGEVAGDAREWDEFVSRKMEDARRLRVERLRGDGARRYRSRMVIVDEGSFGCAPRWIGRMMRAWLGRPSMHYIPCCYPG